MSTVAYSSSRDSVPHSKAARVASHSATSTWRFDPDLCRRQGKARSAIERAAIRSILARMAFQETELVLFTADLAGSTRACAQMTPLEVAAFLGEWYRAIDAGIGRHGGRVVKYMGDGCLATFPPDGSASAIAAAMELRAHRAAGLALDVGVRIHVGIVAEGEVGADLRYDIFGSAVNDLFRMGGAGSVLISEPVYQRLADEDRASWQRHASSASYALAPLIASSTP